jgi:hypothetical protein
VWSPRGGVGRGGRGGGGGGGAPPPPQGWTVPLILCKRVNEMLLLCYPYDAGFSFFLSLHNPNNRLKHFYFNWPLFISVNK